MWNYNYTDELYHHGINGMRWGKRNGPPYPLSAGAHSSSERAAGTSDWSKEAQKEARKARLDRAFTQSEKNGKDKPNISPAEKISKNVSSSVDDTYKVINATRNMRKKKNSIDLSNMSNEELRARINRLDLERRYSSLTEDDIFSGKVYVDSTLDIIGGIAGITGSVIGTIALIKTIK